MPRRADVLQLPETVNGKTAAQKYNNSAFYDTEGVIMRHAKESKDTRLAVTPLLDNYEQALVTSEDPSTASERVAAKLADNFDPLGLSVDPETVAVPKGNEIQYARSAMTSMLDYYVQALDTSGAPSVVSGRVADKVADQLDVLKPKVTYNWLGYNRPPEDAREPPQAKNKHSDKLTPQSADDPGAAVVPKKNEIKRANWL